MGALTLYFPFVRNAFLAMLAYRLRYFTGIVTYFVFVSVHYFIWQAVYAGKGEGAVINGFTLPEMITYVAVGWIARSMYFSDIDEEIDEIVRSGQISVYLLRPVNFQAMMLSQAFGGTLFRVGFFTVPISVVILLCFPVSLPASFGSFVMFLLSLLVAFFIFAQINFLVGLLAFSLKSIQGIVRAKYYLIQFLSGLLLPLTFFPPALRQFLELLPFQTISYVPLQFYLGKLHGTAFFNAILHQVAWVIMLYLLGRICWERALRRLTIQGG